MYPVVLCPSCGANLGPCLAMYYHLKTAIIADRRSKHEEIQSINFGDIVRKLGFDNGCCFSQLHGIQLLPDFGYGLTMEYSMK